MESRSTFLHPGATVTSGRGDGSGPAGRTPARTVRGVPSAGASLPRVIAGPTRPEKPRHEGAACPYRKPTQVGEENTPQANG